MRLFYIRIFETDNEKKLPFVNIDINLVGKHDFVWNEELQDVEYYFNEKYIEK